MKNKNRLKNKIKNDRKNRKRLKNIKSLPHD